MRRFISLFACLALACGAALAQDPPRPGETLSLQAESSNATGVTGDLRFSTDRVVFGNGAVMPIAPDGPGVFRVIDQPDRPLVEGNTLCGMGPVRYVTLHRDPAGLFILNILTDARRPVTPAPETFALDGTCGVYVYMLKGIARQ